MSILLKKMDIYPFYVHEVYVYCRYVQKTYLFWTYSSMVYDRSKPFNSLPLLPPTGIEEDVDILKKLVSSSRALAYVDGNVQRLPNPYMLVNTISLQEAKASSEIENIFTTEDELYKAVSDTIQEGQASPSTKEVLRYRESLWEGYRRIQEKGTIDLDGIVAIFRKIKNTSGGIRPPHSLTVIRPGQSEFRAGEIIYTPPRGPGIVEHLMGNLLDYLNDNVDPNTDPLLKMCISHYQFEAIHPFPDGNGRSGRILNLLYLVNKGLLNHPILYLSKYIIVHKDDYYHHLAGVTEGGKWKPWILYMLDAVEQTAELTIQLITNILEQMESTHEHGRETIKWYTKEINELLFSQPYLKPKLVGDRLKIASRTTLNKYFSELQAAGMLAQIKDGREVYYVNRDLVKILEG
jgi:Fic family protein